jgi:hypothetical protein
LGLPKYVAISIGPMHRISGKTAGQRGARTAFRYARDRQSEIVCSVENARSGEKGLFFRNILAGRSTKLCKMALFCRVFVYCPLWHESEE